jgi:hypothetical protein
MLPLCWPTDRGFRSRCCWSAAAVLSRGQLVFEPLGDLAVQEMGPVRRLEGPLSRRQGAEISRQDTPTTGTETLPNHAATKDLLLQQYSYIPGRWPACQPGCSLETVLLRDDL